MKGSERSMAARTLPILRASAGARVASGMENGGWMMENGGWRMEDGEWRMESG
jgi:hypothetical protein